MKIGHQFMGIKVLNGFFISSRIYIELHDDVK